MRAIKLPPDLLWQILPRLQPRQTKRILDVLRPEKELKNKQLYWQKLFQETFPFLKVREGLRALDYHRRFKLAYEQAMSFVNFLNDSAQAKRLILAAIRGHFRVITAQKLKKHTQDYLQVVSMCFGNTTLPSAHIDVEQVLLDATQYGHLAIVKYIDRSYRADYILMGAFNRAIEHNQVQVMSYLFFRLERILKKTNQADGLIYDAMLLATVNGSLNALEFLHQRFLKFKQLDESAYFNDMGLMLRNAISLEQFDSADYLVSQLREDIIRLTFTREILFHAVDCGYLERLIKPLGNVHVFSFADLKYAYDMLIHRGNERGADRLAAQYVKEIDEPDCLDMMDMYLNEDAQAAPIVNQFNRMNAAIDEPPVQRTAMAANAHPTTSKRRTSIQ